MSNNTEGKSTFFQKALAHFTHEFANGDIIRRYVDRGYSIGEIKAKLDFPTPLTTIHEIAWKHMIDTRKILLDQPGNELAERYEYVKDVSPFGKVSYRRVRVEEDESVNENGRWVREMFSEKVLAGFRSNSSLKSGIKCEVNFEKTPIYAEIPFGLLRYRDPVSYKELLAHLDAKDAEYIDGLFVQRQKIYYRLDEKMLRVLEQLYLAGLYQGDIWRVGHRTRPRVPERKSNGTKNYFFGYRWYFNGTW